MIMKEYSKFSGEIKHTTKLDLILDFYLFNCPCVMKNQNKDKNDKEKEKTPVSQRGYSFGKYGFTAGKITSLLHSMKKDLANQVYSCKREVNSDEISSANKSEEFIFYIPHDRMSKTESIYYMIRNAFAHGSFNIKNGVYYLVSKKKNKYKAIMKLKETTLLKWIKEIQSGNIDR